MILISESAIKFEGLGCYDSSKLGSEHVQENTIGEDCGIC